MEPSVDEVFAAMQAAVVATPSLKSKFNALVEFHLDKGNDPLLLNLSKKESKKKPDLVVKVDLPVFHQILNKKMTAQQAFMKGKLKIKGKMALALKLTMVVNATRKQLKAGRSKL